MSALPVEEAVTRSLDRQAGAYKVTLSAQIIVIDVVARRGNAECGFGAHVVVLIFDAEDHVDQRALVHHVIDAAASIPAAVARRSVEVATRSVASAGDGRAIRPLEISRSITTGREEHPPIPSIAQPRTDRKQVG